MFSTLLELLAFAGLVKTASFIAAWAAWLAGSLSLLFIASTLDDQTVGMKLKRGTAWLRYGWWKQIAKENGALPTPAANGHSPHPPIKVDPQTEEFWARQAKARQERAKVRDRTPALSKQDYDDDFERLG